MQSRYPSYLLDILRAAQLIEQFIVGMDKDAFDEDLKTQSAVIRQLEIIGRQPNVFQMNFERLTQTFPGDKWQGCVMCLFMHMIM